MNYPGRGERGGGRDEKVLVARKTRNKEKETLREQRRRSLILLPPDLLDPAARSLTVRPIEFNLHRCCCCFPSIDINTGIA